MLKLVALIVPLSLDTFALSAALAAGGLGRSERLRIAVVFPLFETAMPIVGLVAGGAAGSALGGVADYVAGGLLVVLGLVFLREDEDGEGGKARLLARAQGLAILALGLSISLDELAIGFTVGLLHLPLAAALALIAAQAVVATQLGLRLGARVGERLREGAERLAGLALLALGAFFVAERAL